jgi:hypothetical protein
LPENRRFRGIATSTLDLSHRAIRYTGGTTLAVLRSALALLRSRRQPIAACIAVALPLAASAYSGIGYFHYKHIAGDEGMAAQRAERANADLQDALDRMRIKLAVAQARIETESEEWRRQSAASEPDNDSRIAQLSRALEQTEHDLDLRDADRAILAGQLNQDPTDGQTEPAPGRSTPDQHREKFQSLSAERDEALAEIGPLRARLAELEQKPSLPQSPVPQAPATAEAAPQPRPAIAPVIVSGPAHSAPVPAAMAPGAAAGVKNFTPPAFVPDHFTGESASMLGNSSAPTPDSADHAVPAPTSVAETAPILQPPARLETVVSPGPRPAGEPVLRVGLAKPQAVEQAPVAGTTAPSTGPQRLVKLSVNHQTRRRPPRDGKVRF